ncbi:MAG TPA: type II secretion system F family protein [Mycobacteriales bacterium]|nr:type II secretion system F family protein [Mycobacteriales bacterium]
MSALAAVLAGVAVAVALGRHRRVLAPPVGPPAPRRGGRSGARPACLVAAVALLALAPGPLGLVPAAAVALVGPGLLGRLEPAAVRRDRSRLLADLPLVLDLLGACLAGGAPLSAAAGAVGTAVRGPAGKRLQRVAGLLAVGAPAGAAWLALGGPDPDDDPLGPAARSLARAAETGAPVAATLARLADDARRASRAAGTQAARRAGVLAVAPLGLCFLPAFVLLGVVPVVAGLAGPLLTTP